MPSHFSTIGFSIASQEEFAALAHQLAADAQPISTKRGEYLQWKGGGGEEMWLQVDHTRDLMGMNPHFAGRSSVTVRIESRVRRPNDTELDGAFHGWAAPTDDVQEGAYPFVFDSPDAGTADAMQLPQVVQVQVAAFAHELSLHDSPEAFSASQAGKVARFASQSFIPSGLFTPGEGKTDPPEAHAIFTGHVREAASRRNSITGAAFRWALVDTLGGAFDVVWDPELLSAVPLPGSVLSGQFWLSGRIVSLPPPKRTWLGKLIRA